MLQIPEFVLELFKSIDFISPIGVVHLGPTCKSGSHQMARVVERDRSRKLFDILRLFRTGTDDRQVSSENIQYLWKFIDMGFSQ